MRPGEDRLGDEIAAESMKAHSDVLVVGAAAWPGGPPSLREAQFSRKAYDSRDTSHRK
jgi:hypothetical protein